VNGPINDFTEFITEFIAELIAQLRFIHRYVVNRDDCLPGDIDKKPSHLI